MQVSHTNVVIEIKVNVLIHRQNATDAPYHR